MIYALLANGFEESEAVVPIDILRRGGLDVRTVGITGRVVLSSHGIPVTCDLLPEECDLSAMELLFLPGGSAGVTAMEESAEACRFLDYAAEKGRFVGAICAAPSFPGKKGLLEGRHFTCFPGFERHVKGGLHAPDLAVVCDGPWITAKAAGVAFEFGFRLLEALSGYEAARSVSDQMHFQNHRLGLT